MNVCPLSHSCKFSRHYNWYLYIKCIYSSPRWCIRYISVQNCRLVTCKSRHGFSWCLSHSNNNNNNNALLLTALVEDEFGQNAINLIARPLTLLSLSTEQDLESGRWPSHQWLLPSQDGRHSGRAGGGARHCPGFPLPVTVTRRCPEFSSPKGALLSALRFHHNKPSKLAPACHLCVYVFMRVCEWVCVTWPLQVFRKPV